MLKKILSIASILAVTATSPAFAKYDCDGGFKQHMGRVSIYVDKMSGYDLADAVRKSLDAYNSCTAGDDFSPHGVWDKIEADAAAKAVH